MGFNLGAFAGGLVSGGLKTYTTLKEQERLDTIEARDKTRFEEEQRLIAERQAAQEIARKAAIPTAADQPGIGVDRVVEAIPRAALYAGNEKGVVGFSEEEVAANEQAFRSTVKGLTPVQQALVLRGYGDQSNAAGQAFEKSQRLGSNNKEGIPAGLNEAVVREDAGGGRSVVTADTDEKKTVARYKAMAMASGNPVAIKASHEAEATMLNREVAQQTLKLGEQNIAMNVFKLSEAQSVADFTRLFNENLLAAKKDNAKLLKEVDEAVSKEGVTVDSLLKQFGVQIKDGTGQSYYAKDGKVYTKDAGGNETVVADSLDQAKVLLKQGAAAHFAHDLSNRIVKEGLFKDANAFNEFYKAEREWVTASANIANTRVMAAAATKNANSSAVIADAATKNANSSAVTADAAMKKANAEASLIKAQVEAGIPGAEAGLKKAQAEQARSTGAYQKVLSDIASDEHNTSKTATTAMKPFLEEFTKLSPKDQISAKGQALLDKAAAASITDAKGAAQVITALKRQDKSGVDARWADIEKGMYSGGSSPADVAAARNSFFASEGYAPSAATQAVLSGKGPGGKPMTEADVDSFNAQFPKSKINKAALPWLKPAAAATTTSAADTAAATTTEAPKSAVQRGIPLRSTDGGKSFYLDVPDTIRDPSVKYYREIPNPAAAALNGKSFKTAAEAEAAYTAAMEAAKKAPAAAPAAPAAPAATALPAAKASAPAAPAVPASAAIAATPAQVKAKLEAKIVSGEMMSTDELNQAKALGLIKEGGASAAPAAPAKKSITAEREDLFDVMDKAEYKLRQDPNNRQRKAAYETAKEKFEAFKKANKLTD